MADILNHQQTTSVEAAGLKQTQTEAATMAAGKLAASAYDGISAGAKSMSDKGDAGGKDPDSLTFTNPYGDVGKAAGGMAGAGPGGSGSDGGVGAAATSTSDGGKAAADGTQSASRQVRPETVSQQGGKTGADGSQSASTQAKNDTGLANSRQDGGTGKPGGDSSAAAGGQPGSDSSASAGGQAGKDGSQSGGKSGGLEGGASGGKSVQAGNIDKSGDQPMDPISGNQLPTPEAIRVPDNNVVKYTPGPDAAANPAAPPVVNAPAEISHPVSGPTTH